jgi:uncharacterized protein (TIGR02118 family)
LSISNQHTVLTIKLFQVAAWIILAEGKRGCPDGKNAADIHTRDKPREAIVIKLVTYQKRAAGMTRPEFENRWRTIHGPMAAKFPNLRGYMLGFSIEAGDPPADGIAQLWFDSREACQASYASDIGRKGSADAIQYLGRREHMLVSEKWRFIGCSLSETPFKLVISGKRQMGMARGDFCESWQAFLPDLPGQVKAQSARVCVDEAGQLLNSKTDGNLSLISGEGVYDGMIELWFSTPDELKSAINLVRAEYTEYLDAELSKYELGALGEEIVVRPPPGTYEEMEQKHD